MGKSKLSLYNKFHVDKKDERLGLFLTIADTFRVKSVLYPGCFVHVTPSFVFPKVVYVDTDKRANAFFNDPGLLDFVSKKKLYKTKTTISFHNQDYTKRLEEKIESFDLLISQFAGFISPSCKKYLKIGGILVANDSHGDASMAFIDKDYELVGVIGSRYVFSDKALDKYFVQKKQIRITKKYLKETGKGPRYTKSATAYVFKRIN